MVCVVEMQLHVWVNGKVEDLCNPAIAGLHRSSTWTRTYVVVKSDENVEKFEKEKEKKKRKKKERF